MPPVRAAIRNYLIFAVVFLLLIIFLPANKAFLDAYHLTSKQYHGLLFLAELPLLAVWFGAFLGYAKLEEYAFTLIGTKEGDAYARMSAGAKWLAFGIALPTIVFFVFSSFAGNHPAWQSAAIILSNYVGLALSLTAFLKMSEGTRKLRLTRKIHQPASAIRWLQLLFAVLGALYCLLIFRQLDLSSLGSTNNPYYLPVWLLVLTLIVPYLYAWFLGLLTAFDMWLVACRSAGYLYRGSIMTMAIGLVGVIAARIGIQYSVSIIPRDRHYTVDNALVFLYMMYVLTILGFVAFIYGINRLKRIEEV
jgi:hypothetical protein